MERDNSVNYVYHFNGHCTHYPPEPSSVQSWTQSQQQCDTEEAEMVQVLFQTAFPLAVSAEECRGLGIIYTLLANIARVSNSLQVRTVDASFPKFFKVQSCLFVYIRFETIKVQIFYLKFANFCRRRVFLSLFCFYESGFHRLVKQ